MNPVARVPVGSTWGGSGVGWGGLQFSATAPATEAVYHRAAAVAVDTLGLEVAREPINVAHMEQVYPPLLVPEEGKPGRRGTEPSTAPGAPGLGSIIEQGSHFRSIFFHFLPFPPFFLSLFLRFLRCAGGIQAWLSLGLWEEVMLIGDACLSVWRVDDAHKGRGGLGWASGDAIGAPMPLLIEGSGVSVGPVG